MTLPRLRLRASRFSLLIFVCLFLVTLNLFPSSMLLSTQVVLVTLGATAAALPSASSAASAPTGFLPPGFDITAYWGNLRPYKDASGFNVSTGVPLGCELSQVHILHRHAQRYPTAYPLDAGSMEGFAQKLHNHRLQYPNVSLGTGPLAFLNDWKYLMGTELLLPSGAATEATSGAHFWNKYGRPLFRAPAGLASWDPSLNVYPNGTQRPKPVFRSTDQARILESARWWLSGFFSSTNANSSASEYDLVVIPESAGYNNTLAATCPNTDWSIGDNAAKTFLNNTFPEVLTTLAPHLPKTLTATLEPIDILGLINMCPYETAVLGSSNFCPLFTEDQWSAYGYTLDLQFYGDYGPGSPSGRAQGLGWVLELAARLNHTLPSTQSANINLTLDANPATFPVHQPLYMDMSHDDVIVSVLTALGMQYFTFPGGKGLPRDVREPPARRFKLGEIAPFGAHFVAEVYSCPSDMDRVVLGGETMYENPDLSGSGVETEEWLRFVLNGKPVPLEGVSGCEGGNDGGHGMCRVKGFLGGVEEMVRVAEWDRACLGNYTSPGQVGDGHPV